MRGSLRRPAVAVTMVALAAVTIGVASAWGQDAPSGTGHKDAGESSSAWHGVIAFVGWFLLAAVVFGLLVWMAIGRRRGTATPPDEPHPAAAATGSPRPPRAETDARELTALLFEHTDGAERAYAAARGRANSARWLREVAFVESHRHGRILVRGTFAGHYLDVHDVADAIGRDTAVGAVAGAVVGLAFGPPGFAADLVAGGARESPEERGALFDGIRRTIPERSSGLVALVSPDDSEALIDALHDRAVRTTRHRVSAAESAAFAAAVADAPPAATPDV